MILILVNYHSLPLLAHLMSKCWHKRCFLRKPKIYASIREAAKNGPFFSGPATRGGERRAWPLRKKTVFSSSKKNLEKNVVANKREGGGGEGGLSGRAAKKILFLRLP